MQISRKRTFMSNPVPVPYTRLEYILNSGTQYINTGKAPSDSSRYELSFYAEPKEGSDRFYFVLFGSNTQDSPVNGVLFRYDAYDTSDYMTPWFGQPNSKNRDPLFYCEQNAAHAVTLKMNECVYDGTSYQIASSSVTNSYPVYLFAGNYGNSMWRSGKFRCYSFKIYESDSLVLDLIPVKDPDGTVCMYDKVSKSFFYNQGTGSFIAGPEA